MALALRTANQGELEGGIPENTWDFGQTTAVVLLVMAARELITKGLEFFLFERDLKRGVVSKSKNRREHGREHGQGLMGVSSVEEGLVATPVSKTSLGGIYRSFTM